GQLATLRRKVRGVSRPASERSPVPNVPTVAPVAIGDLLHKIAAALRRTVAELLKLRLEDVELETDLSEYGFDSISLTELANMLNRAYGLELVPTVFFEHANLAGLARYLHTEHQAVLAVHFQPRPEEGRVIASHGPEGEQSRGRRRSHHARVHAVASPVQRLS